MGRELLLMPDQESQPPEAGVTFDRLTGLGYSRRDAFLLIKMVIIAEVWRSAEIGSLPASVRIIQALE